VGTGVGGGTLIPAGCTLARRHASAAAAARCTLAVGGQTVLTCTRRARPVSPDQGRAVPSVAFLCYRAIAFLYSTRPQAQHKGFSGMGGGGGEQEQEQEQATEAKEDKGDKEDKDKDDDEGEGGSPGPDEANGVVVPARRAEVRSDAEALPVRVRVHLRSRF
jgi:hypothetical protein